MTLTFKFYTLLHLQISRKKWFIFRLEVILYEDTDLIKVFQLQLGRKLNEMVNSKRNPGPKKLMVNEPWTQYMNEPLDPINEWY